VPGRRRFWTPGRTGLLILGPVAILVGIVAILRPTCSPETAEVSAPQEPDESTPSCDRIIEHGMELASRTSLDPEAHVAQLVPMMGCIEQDVDRICEVAEVSRASDDLVQSGWSLERSQQCIDGLLFEERWEEALAASGPAVELAGAHVHRTWLREQRIQCLVSLGQEDEALAERDQLASESDRCRAYLAVEAAFDRKGTPRHELGELTSVCALEEAGYDHRLLTADMLFDKTLYGWTRDVLVSMDGSELAEDQAVRLEILWASLDLVEGRQELGRNRLEALYARPLDRGTFNWLARAHVHGLDLIGDVEGMVELYTRLVGTRPQDVDADLWSLVSTSLAANGRLDLVTRLGPQPPGCEDVLHILEQAELRELIEANRYPEAWSELGRIASAAKLDDAIQAAFWTAHELFGHTHDAPRYLGVLLSLEEAAAEDDAAWLLVSCELVRLLAELDRGDEARSRLRAMSEARFAHPEQEWVLGTTGGAMARIHTRSELADELRSWETKGHAPEVIVLLRLGAADERVRQGAYADARGLLEPIAGTPLNSYQVDRYYAAIVQAHVGDGLLAEALDLPGHHPVSEDVSPCRPALAIASGIPRGMREAVSALDRALAACDSEQLDVWTAGRLVEGLCALDRCGEAMEILDRVAAASQLSPADELELEIQRARVLLGLERPGEAVRTLQRLTTPSERPESAVRAMTVLLLEVYPRSDAPVPTVLAEAEAFLAGVGAASDEGRQVIDAVVRYSTDPGRFEEAIRWQDEHLLGFPAGSGEQRAWELLRRARLESAGRGLQAPADPYLDEGLREAPAGSLVRREIVLFMAALTIARQEAAGAQIQQILTTHADRLENQTAESIRPAVAEALMGLDQHEAARRVEHPSPQ